MKVVLDGGALVNWMTSATHVAPQVPAALDELAHGRPQRIAQQWAGGKLSPQAMGRVAHGLVYGVFCSEWTPYESEDAALRAGRAAFPSFPARYRPRLPARLPPPGLRRLERTRGGALDPGRHPR